MKLVQPGDKEDKQNKIQRNCLRKQIFGTTPVI